MAPRLPVPSAREVLRALSRVGFRPVGQRGSHIRLKNAGGRLVIVPRHSEIGPTTLKSILRQAGLSRDDFMRLL